MFLSLRSLIQEGSTFSPLVHRYLSVSGLHSQSGNTVNAGNFSGVAGIDFNSLSTAFLLVVDLLCHVMRQTKKIVFN